MNVVLFHYSKKEENEWTYDLIAVIKNRTHIFSYILVELAWMNESDDHQIDIAQFRIHSCYLLYLKNNA